MKALKNSHERFADHDNDTGDIQSVLFQCRYKLTADVATDQWHISIITRHSLIRVKGKVFVLLYVCFFLFAFLSTISRQPRADSRQILHAGVLWFWMCLLCFWGLAAPGGRKRGK